MARRYKDRPPDHTTFIVANRSSRRGAPINAIAVHSTESQDLPGTTDDLKGIRNWFNNPQSDASAHIGVDGDGHSEKWVMSSEKAWTILDLNPVTLNIEFVGRAAQRTDEWEEAQLKTGAKWAAYWCIRFDLPAQRGHLKRINGVPVVTKKGVIRHSDLTELGFGSHTDPGKGFPLGEFLDLVRFYKRRGWTLDITGD